MPRPPIGELVDAGEMDLAPVLEPDPLDLRVSLLALSRWGDSEHVRRMVMAAVDFPTDDVQAFLAVNQLTLRGALRATELAEALQTGRSNLSKIARRLAELGLAARTADPGDERGVLIALTPTGRAVGRRIVDYTGSRLRQTLADWDEDEVLQFQRLLAKFVTSMTPPSTDPETGGFAFPHAGP